MDEEAVEKLSFEGKDFKFMAAFGVYSRNFDEANEVEEKVRLNQVISRLEKEEISYPEYYELVNAKDNTRRYRFHRTRIDSSSKRDYQAKQRREGRNSRYR